MSNERIDLDFEAKLHLYKTAFSPLYNTYVGIEKVRKLADGSYVLNCTVASKTDIVLFRPYELTNYVL